MMMMEIDQAAWLPSPRIPHACTMLMELEAAAQMLLKTHRPSNDKLPTFPTELLFRVFEFMHASEVDGFMDLPICKSWRSIETDDFLFNLMCRKIWGTPEKYSKSNWRSTFKTMVRAQYVVEHHDYKALIKTCRDHLAVPKLQELGCTRLGDMALHEEFRLLVGQSGGISVVLNSMRAHPTDANVQQEACKSLVVLARPLGGAEGKAFTGREDALTNVTLIGQESGVQLVLDAMRRHPLRADVQATGCWALVNLALISHHKCLIVSEGGVELILAAMGNHPKDAEVQYRACFVLVNLAIPESNKSMIVDLGGVGLILNAMRNHPSHPTLQHRACLVLRNLAFKVENRPVLRREGAVELIKAAMAAHLRDEGLQMAGYNAIVKLQ